MKKIVLGLAVAAIAVSCKKELEVQEPMYSAKDTATGRAPQSGTPANTFGAQGRMPTQAVNPPHGQPGHRCDIAEGAPLNVAPANQQTTQVANIPPAVTATASKAAKTAAGMNPPHGQPGHRCDIAVGAPLASAPAPKGAASIAAVNPTTGKAGDAKPIKTAPGMNPPHGEPGHRCDIAVGAPLTSAPAKTEATTQVPATLAAPSEEAKD